LPCGFSVRAWPNSIPEQDFTRRFLIDTNPSADIYAVIHPVKDMKNALYAIASGLAGASMPECLAMRCSAAMCDWWRSGEWCVPVNLRGLVAGFMSTQTFHVYRKYVFRCRTWRCKCKTYADYNTLAKTTSLWYTSNMKTALYARVSTSDQKCDMQLTELRRYAAAQGLTIDPENEYIDTGCSGATTNRPQFKRCLADALKRRFDVLLVWRLDRWGRSVAQLASDIPALDAAGVRFICPGQGIDTAHSNPMSRAMLQLMAVFAELERAMILERVASGISQYRDDFAAGKIGKTKHSRSGKDLAPHRPRKVFNRQRIIELRRAGMSLNQIVAETAIPKTTICRVIAESAA